MTPKAAIIFDSNYGNNMRLAQSLCSGLNENGVKAECLKIGSFAVQHLSSYDFLAVGGPTNMAQMSKPMKEFFDQLKQVDIKGKQGFCWGTRVQSKMNIFDINGSAKKIEAKLKRKNVRILKPAVNVIVEGRDGPVTDGSYELFTMLGEEIAQLLEA